MPFPDITQFSPIIYIFNRANSPSPPPSAPHGSDLISFESEESPPRQILDRTYGYILYQIPEDKKMEISYSPLVVIIPKATLVILQKKLSVLQPIKYVVKLTKHS